MGLEGWHYYNHAVVPDCAPHETPDLTPVYNDTIWKNFKVEFPLLTRWTTDWDCGYETEWWYVIKDTPFDISALKSKRRYEINKGKKNFNIREIIPNEYYEDIYRISASAWGTYPESYRPQITRNSFINEIKEWKYYKVYGAFDDKENKLYGFARINRDRDYIDFVALKVMPDKEKYGINAALINHILEDNSSFLASNGYICDGCRSINHETNFQDYLEKYFGFRKAYCTLHVKYKRGIRILIKILYPLRYEFARLNSYKIFHKIYALLKMEEIARKCNE